MAHDAHPEHGGVEARHLSCGRARTAGQGGQLGAKRGIQPLDVGGVDHPERDLGGLHDRLGAAHAPMGQSAVDASKRPSRVLFDDLYVMQVGPGRKAIDGPEARASHLRCGAHLGDHLGDQGGIPLRGDHTPEEQPREDTHRRGYPHRARLGLDVQRITLHLIDIDMALTYHLFLDGFRMRTNLALLIGHRALIQAKGKHDGRNRTPAGQQGQHEQHHPQGAFESLEGYPLPTSLRMALQSHPEEPGNRP